MCETLCFIRQHYDKLQISELKAIICSFYNEDELFGAKDILLKVIGQVLHDGDVDVELMLIRHAYQSDKDRIS